MDLKLRHHFEQMSKMLTMLETAVTDYTKSSKFQHKLHHPQTSSIAAMPSLNG